MRLKIQYRTKNSDNAYFQANAIESGHKQRSLRSGAVSIAAKGANAFIQVGSVIVLARLLSPEDYGLVSMVTSLTAWALMLVHIGTDEAVVQRPEISSGEVSALFWMTVVMGMGSGLLVAGCGPLLAWFYGEPRLIGITFVAALTFVTSGVSCQHLALMRRAMKFDEICVIEISASVLSAIVAIIMAYQGSGYWALVLRPVLMNAFLAAGLWIRCRWIPGWPRITTAVKDMVRFGLNSTGFTISDVGARSADKVAIGYRAGAAALGHYQNAMLIYDNLLGVLAAPLHPVAVASLSKVANNPGEFKRLWGKALSTLAFWSMPAFGLLAVTSQDVVVLLLGVKWASAGVLLSILALRGIPHTVERTLGWLHVPAGRTDRWMRWGIIATIVQCMALLGGLPFGAIGVTTAYVISMFILFIPAIVYAGQPLGIGARDLMHVVWRPLIGCLVAAGIGFALRYTAFSDVHAFLRMTALGIIYGTTYLALVVGLLGERTPLEITLSAAQSFLPPRVVQFLGLPRLIETEG